MLDQESNDKQLSVGQAATLAVFYEVTAPKPGNVHRGADFEDVTYVDFIQSAIVVGPIMERGIPQPGEPGRPRPRVSVGRTILESVRTTREVVATNTNLGTLLLIAPLAAVPRELALAQGIQNVLNELTFDDTRDVYEAIRLASAGGLGTAAQADVAAPPPADLKLVEAMRLAADRDLVARQYTNQFADVFRTADTIEEGVGRGWPLATAIVHAQIRQMAAAPDSLILRKCGPQVAEESRVRAARVLTTAIPGDDTFNYAIEDFDFWLRSDGHRRNPGTTADLIAAGLFVLLREGRLELKSAARSLTIPALD